MSKEYIIPLGVDGTTLAKGVSEMANSLESLEEKGGQVGKTINESFNQGAKASKELDNAIKSNAKNLDTMRDAGRLAGKELAEAFNSGDTSDMEAKIENFKSKLAGITANIDIELDDDKIRIFEQEISAAKDDIQALNIVLNQSREILSQLDPNSEEFQALSGAIDFTSSALGEFENNVVATVEKSKSMKAELRGLQQEMARMESAGEADSEVFREMAIRAGELKDQIGDTAQQVSILASDTKNVDALISGVEGLAGAFALVQGASALFGEESEDLQKTLLKVNAAMAVLQGLQSVMNTLNKDSAFNVVILSKAKSTYAAVTGTLTGLLSAETAATSAATIATQAFGFALKALGIGLVITAIALLVEYWDELYGWFKKLLPAGTDVGKMFDQVKVVVMGVGNVILQYLIAPVKAFIALIHGDLDGAIVSMVKQMDVVNNYTAGANMQRQKNAEQYALEAKEQSMKQWAEAIEIEEARGKDVYQTQKRWHENNIALLKKTGGDYEAAQKDLRLFLAKREGEDAKKAEESRKKAEADAKKAADEAKRKREQAQREAEAQAKKDADLVYKYGQEIAKMSVGQIENQYERERKSIQIEIEKKIAELKRDGAKSKEAIAARNALIFEIEREGKKKLQDLEDEHNKKILKLKLEGQKMLVELQKDGLDKELNQLALDTQDKLDTINEQYAEEDELRQELIEAVIKNDAEKRKEITKKYGDKTLAREEEIALLSIELSSKYAIKSEETERQKQIALLETKIYYAEKALALLVDDGTDESKRRILQAKKQIQDLKNALGDELDKGGGKGFNLMDFLGLTKGMDAKDSAKVKAYMNQFAQNLRQLTDFMIDQYDRQIEKKQEIIDQLDDEINNLSSRLDEEKDLKEQGLANDVENIEKQLAEKQRQKDEEIRQQNELVKKKKELQRIEMIADTAYQVVGLITASVDIFKSFAKLPFGIGIPLAIAVVGSMVGAFAAAKIKAFQAVNDGQKMQGGGTIKGKLHSQGGEKFYSASGENYELEEGEKVTNRASSHKYGKLLDAINEDDFGRLPITDGGLQAMFSKMGLSFQTDEIFKASKMNSGLKVIMFSKDGEKLDKINQGIKYLVEDAQNTPKEWTKGGFKFTKIGNRVFKEPINQKSDEPEK